MARSQLVDDGFWELVKPLLGITPRSTHRAPESVTGQSVHGDHGRAGEWGALAGGLSADQLCSGVSAWRQLWEWQRAGVWERVHRELLRHLERRWPDRLVAGSRRLEPHPRPSRGA